MIEIYENKWRPFIVLTDANYDDGGKVFFDVCRRPILSQRKDCTIIECENAAPLFVKETAEDIIAAADRLIDKEADKKAKEAAEYMAATMERAKEFGEKHGDN